MRLKPTIILGKSDERSDFSPRDLVHSTNFWIGLCYALFYLVAYQYCQYAYGRDPTSFFFDSSKGYQRVYSLKREQQADAFIETANRSTEAPKSQTNPSICLGIATIARAKEQYIRCTVGSLLEGLTETQRDSIHLVIFFAQTNPHEHPIYNEPWLQHVVNEIVEYDVGEKEIARLRILEEKHQFWNKSMYDYEYLLKTCLITDADWIMIVEDDVLAKEGWYPQAMKALTDIQAQMHEREWLYLCLFYTEKLFGWNSEEWLQYLGWSLFAFLVTGTALIFSRSYSRRLRKHMFNYPIAIICFFCLPATILLYFMAGRVSMQPPPSGLHRREQFGCCSQGLIFPKQIVPRAMDTVRHATNKRYYVDMTLERFGTAKDLPRFALIPPLLSTLAQKAPKAQNSMKALIASGILHSRIIRDLRSPSRISRPSNSSDRTTTSRE